MAVYAVYGALSGIQPRVTFTFIESVWDEHFLEQLQEVSRTLISNWGPFNRIQ